MAKINTIIPVANASVIRDKIAEILKVEIDNQYALSPAEDVFNCEHYVERFTPYSDYEDHSVTNVFYVQSANVKNYGNKRIYTSEFHVEHFVKQKESQPSPADNKLADTIASENLQRLLFVSEAILMSTEYPTLDLQDIVRGKKIPLITSSPTERGMATGNEVAGRIVIEIEHEEIGNISTGQPVAGIDSLFKKVPSEYGIKLVKN